MQKVLKHPIFGAQAKQDPTLLEQFAHAMSNKSTLKKTYLTKDWLETKKLVEKTNNAT